MRPPPRAGQRYHFRCRLFPVRRAPSRGGRRRLVALAVHDQQCGGVRGLRVAGLVAEEALAAGHDRYLAVPERPIVAAVASQAEAPDAALHTSRAGVAEGAELVALFQVVEARRGALVEVRERDGLEFHSPAGIAEPVRYVLGRRLGPRRAGGAVAAVLVGDLLQLAQVLAQPWRADLRRLDAAVAGGAHGRAGRRRLRHGTAPGGRVLRAAGRAVLLAVPAIAAPDDERA